MSAKDVLRPTVPKVLTVLFVYVAMSLGNSLTGKLFFSVIPKELFDSSQILESINLEGLMGLLPQIILFAALAYVIEIFLVYVAVCLGFHLHEKSRVSKK